MKMKYTCTVQINLPINEVVELWANEQYFYKWQDGFTKIEPISGKQGGAGAKAKIYLNDGKRKMELLETIIVNNLPSEKTALYEHKHMTNTQTTKFTIVSENETKYTSEVEYIKFNGFMPKLMAKLMPHVFRKQSLKWMIQFKIFAEMEYKQ